MDLLNALLLIVAANAAPVVARLLLGRRFEFPVDGGRLWFDQRPLFGSAKTLRGLLASLLVSTLLALLLDYGALLGFIVGGATMCGDLLTSFIKRRFDLPAHHQLYGFDQFFETLLPLLVLQQPLDLSGRHLLLIYLAFTLLNVLLTYALHRSVWRKNRQAERR
ncbi:MAG: CDP-archaeol synthase [Gammaproteobacteria bacterium]|nr:CDP-archaeol synthase [Gammaproteobacteria bacterium]